MEELLPYTRFLYLLQLIFGEEEFVTSEVSREFTAFFEIPHQEDARLTRFNPKLFSNGLRRLWAHGPLSRRETPRGHRPAGREAPQRAAVRLPDRPGRQELLGWEPLTNNLAGVQAVDTQKHH